MGHPSHLQFPSTQLITVTQPTRHGGRPRPRSTTGRAPPPCPASSRQASPLPTRSSFSPQPSARPARPARRARRPVRRAAPASQQPTITTQTYPIRRLPLPPICLFIVNLIQGVAVNSPMTTRLQRPSSTGLEASLIPNLCLKWSRLLRSILLRLSIRQPQRPTRPKRA